MELRVVSDQPWDVAADVLAVPFAGRPAFDGVIGEIDRRSGGTLAALAAFGEFKADRYGATLVAATGGELRSNVLLAVGAGPARPCQVVTTSCRPALIAGVPCWLLPRC